MIQIRRAGDILTPATVVHRILPLPCTLDRGSEKLGKRSIMNGTVTFNGIQKEARPRPERLRLSANIFIYRRLSFGISSSILCAPGLAIDDDSE